MNEHEKAYIKLMNLNENGDGDELTSFIYKISSKPNITTNNFGDISVRNFPHCESKHMFQIFKGSQLESRNIDLSEYNKKNLGEHISNFNTDKFENFNTINISGPKEILDAFMNQQTTDRKINIMFNSIRNIPSESKLCRFNLKDLDITLPKVQEYISNYGNPIQKKSIESSKTDTQLNDLEYAINDINSSPDKIQLDEEPITQQYCNFYEYLDMKTKEDYLNKFVVIITNEKLLNVYRELYPHFIIVTQPNVSFQCVGLTRYTALAVSSHVNLNRVIFSDDNVININIPNFNYDTQQPSLYTSYRLQNTKILEELFTKDELQIKQLNNEYDKNNTLTKIKDAIKTINLNEYGYLGSSNGFGGFNNQASWVQHSFKNDYFHDYTINDLTIKQTDMANIKDSSQINNINIFMRDFINKPRFISEIPTSDTAGSSFINPHRLKFIIVNVQVIKSKNITYNPLHTMAEDIYFTREIFQKGLKTCQISIGITLPKDSRRPITCVSTTVCKLEDNYNLIESNQIVQLKQVFPHRSDLITYLGGLLFYNKSGVLAYGGAFGPAKLLDIQLASTYNESLKNKITSETEISDENKQACFNKFSTKFAVYKGNNEVLDMVNYIEPNKYKSIIYENDSYNKKEQERMTETLDYFVNKMSKITNTKTRREYIKNFLKSYVMWYDIISVSNQKTISGSTGMFKYVREYELENILSFESFAEFYKDTLNKDKIDIIYTKINKILKDKDKDICNRKNDILFYIENFTMYTEEIFKLLCLYIIYTKMYQFVNTYTKDGQFIVQAQKDKSRMLLLFGNVNDTIYINQNVRAYINEYMNLLIQSYTGTQTSELIPKINIIYKKILNEYLP